jgi:two-component system cell cycle response regulator DivK
MIRHAQLDAATREVLSGKRLFIVEDNLENRFITRMALTNTGVVLEFDAWGRETVRKLRAFAPVDLILLDLMLPQGISGFTIYDQLRADPAFAAVPVIAVSASDPAQAIPRCRKAGFMGFIAKPINADTFADQIAAVLSGNRIWEA